MMKTITSKEIFIKIIFCFVIIYLVTLLIFVTLKNVYSLEANYLSALGSMFSAGATCLASFVAYWLYNDWKDPHAASFYVNECKATLNCYKELLLITRKLKFIEEKFERIIFHENGSIKQPSLHLSTQEKEILKILNSDIDKLILNSFETIDKLTAELIMLNSLTQDPNYLFDSIELQNNLLPKLKAILETDATTTPYSKYNKLKIDNNYLIIQGPELIKRIKKLGQI